MVGSGLEAVPELQRMAQDSDPRIRTSALRILRSFAEHADDQAAFGGDEEGRVERVKAAGVAAAKALEVISPTPDAGEEDDPE
jgi:HEAT repeat